MKANVNWWMWLGILSFILVALLIFYLWYQTGQIFEWRLSLDGLMTLAGGALAFIAVMAQISAQRNESREEQERRKRSVARGLYIEVRDVSGYCLELCDLSLSREMGRAPLYFTPSNFYVYRANASGLGAFGEMTASAVVGFYTSADELFHYLNLLQWASDNYDPSQGHGRTFPAKLTQEEHERQVEQSNYAREALGVSRGKIEELKKKLNESSSDALALLREVANFSPEAGPTSPESTTTYNAQTH